MSSPSASSTSSWLDRKCDDFEKQWRQGRRPRLEDFLEGSPAEQKVVLLRELIAVEVELRQRNGELVRRSDYFTRFPEATTFLDEFQRSFAAEASPTQSFQQAGTIPNVVTTSARYRDLQEFRKGGLGILFRGVDESLHRETVVKFMHENCAKDPNLTAQFRIEAEITSRLDHPGIVPVYGIGEDWQGSPFYVMRLVKGREFKQAIQEYHAAGGPGIRGSKNRQLLFALLDHLTSACNTVAYAHHVGIVHCDIKPSNIMIGKYGETFVLDWGLATPFERTTTFFVQNEPTMRPRSVQSGSHSGNRGGTYGYISPEQLQADGAPAPTSDVYSLGATLFEVLTGRPPFNGRDTDITQQIQRGSFPRPRSLQPGVPRRLEAICLKAMALHPNDRYTTAKQLANDISNWMHDEEIEAAPDRWYDRLMRLARRHRGFTASCIAIAFILLVGLGWTDRMNRLASHERILREKDNEKHAAQQLSFTTALDTFEDICRPLADGEMNNLNVLRPFLERIRDFTTVYLDKFENVEEMQHNTARVYELRAILSQYSDDDDNTLQEYTRSEEIYLRMAKANPLTFEDQLRLAHPPQPGSALSPDR